MRRLTSPALLLLLAVASSGCAVAHRYPAYRGRVLELGTDKPIEGAGVLAVYWKYQSYLVHAGSQFLGYQAVLTDKEGRFEIPPKLFFALTPFSWFDREPFFSIYKRGYGNFPGSFDRDLSKHGNTDIPVAHSSLPPDRAVTFWLPKLTTEEERKKHDDLFSAFSPILQRGVKYPPPGYQREQFEPIK